MKLNRTAKICCGIPATIIGYKIGCSVANFVVRAVRQYSRTYISKCRDVYLDPHDQLDYVEKGGVYDREAQNLLRALEDVLLHDNEEGLLHNGTHRDAIKWTKDVLTLCCAKSHRVGYIVELSATLPLFFDCIEKATEEKGLLSSSGFSAAIDHHPSGERLNVTEVVYQSLLICEARLADAEIRVIRDVLLDTVQYLQEALQYWRNCHTREMKVLRFKATCKALLHVIFYHKNSYESTQQHVLLGVNELPSSKCIVLLELLLRRCVRRLSVLQNHLQGLPNVSGQHTGGELTGRGVVDTTFVCALEHWIYDALALITKTLNEESTMWDTGTYFSNAAAAAANIESSGVEMLRTTEPKDLNSPMGQYSFCDMLYPSKTLELVYNRGWNVDDDFERGGGKGGVENRSYGSQEWLSHAIHAVKEEKRECGGWTQLQKGRGRMRDGLSLCEKSPQVARLYKSQRSRVESSLRKAGAMHESQKAWLIRTSMFPMVWIGLISIGGKLAYKRKEELLHLGWFQTPTSSRSIYPIHH